MKYFLIGLVCWVSGGLFLYLGIIFRHGSAAVALLFLAGGLIMAISYYFAIEPLGAAMRKGGQIRFYQGEALITMLLALSLLGLPVVMYYTGKQFSEKFLDR